MAEGSQVQLLESTFLSSPWKGTNGAGNVALVNSSGIANATTTPAFTAGSNRPFSSTTPLGGTGAITSTVVDALGGHYAYGYYQAMAYSDQTGTLFVEYSTDNATWYPANGLAGTAVAAGATVVVKVPIATRYVRHRYVNGATPQTTFLTASEISLA